MIHYTLLPEDEMKRLRREYRMRFFIVLLFFISCALFIGIVSLLPSYILSTNKENRALAQAQEVQKKREASGADQVEKDLVKAQTIARKILAENTSFYYSDIIQHILSHRSNKITVTSFEASRDTGTSTPVRVIIQGKAVSREGLTTFKSVLERDSFFTQVELPVSDLAKSKDISFSMRLTISTEQKK